MATATMDAVRLPPAPPIPKLIQGAGFLLANSGMFAAMARRYGDAFTVEMPFLGRAVVLTDPTLIKELFALTPDLAQRPASGVGSLGQAFGPGSTFSLAGDPLIERRKLLVPPFHGKRMRAYEHIIEDEVLREIATWPQGQEFETLEPMLRLTLGSILRAVFGAEGPILEELRDLLPPLVVQAARVVVAPQLMRRDLGRWSPGGRFLAHRRRFDALVAALISEARADPQLEKRGDVLALLLQARYDTGEPISDQHIADELLTLVASGHETTAASLAWSIERLRRHPELLDRLTDEVDAGGSELRQATIREVQRVRPVLDGSMRRTQQRIRLGDWVIPEDTTVVFSIRLAHESDDYFDDAASFNPDRFIDDSASPAGWIPFGRYQPLHRRIVRAHGDGRGVAHAVPRVSVCTNGSTRRTPSLAWSGHCPRTGRQSRTFPTFDPTATEGHHNYDHCRSPSAPQAHRNHLGFQEVDEQVLVSLSESPVGWRGCAPDQLRLRRRPANGIAAGGIRRAPPLQHPALPPHGLPYRPRRQEGA